MKYSFALFIFLVSTLLLGQDVSSSSYRIKDLATLEGVRDNPLLGYGVVVGLNGTGDTRQTVFTAQTLSNVLHRMGIQVPATSMQIKNTAAVFVTANLPPFSRPGTVLDVTVSSIGDARSLDGGFLLLTSLYGADGQPYGAAQGAVNLGGFSAGGQGNSKQVNHPTVGRVPSGGTVERDTAVDLTKMETLALVLREADFAGARDVAAAINHEFHKDIARAVDGRRVEVASRDLAGEPLPSAMARIEALTVSVRPRAKVVVNERTGTVVMGRDVRLSAVSILHGSLTIDVATHLEVSQPGPFSAKAETAVVPQTKIAAQESLTRHMQLQEGATVEDLVHGLQSIGVTARDVVAILQAIKAAGALQAELEVI